MSDEWQYLPLASVVDRVTEKNVDGINKVFSVSAQQGLVDQEKYFNKRVASKNLSGYWVVRAGDYVFNKSYSEGFPLGVVARNLDEEPGVVSPLYIVMRQKVDAPVCDGWLDLAFRSTDYATSLQGLMKEGGRAHGALNVKLTDYFTALIPVPPLPVQRRIVDLLAHLDNHLANLQNEREEATHLGIAYRREVFGALSAPTSPASEVFDMMLGRQKSAKQSIGSHVIPYIRAANISESGLRLSDVQLMNFEPHEQQRYGLSPDDILLVEGGNIGLAARWSGEIDGPVGFDKHVIRLRPRDGLSTSEYALQWARYSREIGAFDAQATGITIRALGFGRASAMPIPKVSIAEQERICQPMSAIDSSITALDAEILNLRLFRDNLLIALLSDGHSIPAIYDSLLSEVA